MAQKFKVLVCDRPFKCPVCKRDFVVGDEIILLLPQKTRYCSRCGTDAIQRIDNKALGLPVDTPMPTAAPASPVTTTTICNCGFVLADDQARFDKVWKALEALEKRFDNVDNLVDNHENRIFALE